MKLALICLQCVLVCVVALPQHVTQLPNFTKLSAEEIRHLQNRGFGPTSPSPFRPTLAYEEDEDDHEDDISLASTQQQRPVYANEAYLQNVIPVVRVQQRPQPVRKVQQEYVPKPNYEKQSNSKVKGKEEEVEEEEEEPDRLTVLLAQSKFDCVGKKTGYYADENLGCEVFHYCQENAKHSWICPEGFTFHQVHLICMPPSGDNICEKSSQFHFVNDYLYKPLNLEEHQSKPNVSLKYSDRYYPEQYTGYNQYEEDNEDGHQYHHQQKKPIRVGLQQQQQPPKQSTVKYAQQDAYNDGQQVFRSPEEVNISLQQRRPQYVTQRYRQEYDFA
ncbi:PREDICTED: uncharacterized protein LOC108559250 [Nicrophorus vespilloides]|uniref:Uncharacterized protein LOC108559250 n=1 Tax=Nicrophorus vespilloides TaxID=110193 RepID=A0ABM1MBJ9_NICVS|nr:PREDICTED: uncharacterized protein LOC108559250 [Nicrophorus vespilloides]